MSNPVINIGVLGAANIAEKFVIPAILSLPDSFKLTAIASRSPIKAHDFSKKFNVDVYEDYGLIIDDPAIDAVYIPLPNALHSHWIKKALIAGKHVLVEKSMACTLEEVIALNALAAEKKLVLMENFQFRFHKQLDKIKQLLADGAIGELRQIRSAFGFPPFPDYNNIRYQKRLGGGSLLDAGAYPIKVTQEIIDDSLYVDSASLFIDPYLNVDIWGSAQLKSLNSKVTSQISFGFDNAYKCELEIWGSKGYIKANRIFTSPPGSQATVIIETAEGQKALSTPNDNHFGNLLNKFHSYIVGNEDCKKEYISNIIQAELISQVQNLAEI